MRKEASRKVDEFYRQLKRDIVMTRLLPGQQITELELAASLDCSQSTVREVLLRLKEEGLIVREGYRGTSVALISPVEAKIFLDLRTRLEVQAARLSLPALTEEDLGQLRLLIEEMEEAARHNDAYTLFEKDQEFHVTLFKRANLPSLTSVLSRFSIYSHRDKIAHESDSHSLMEKAQRHWQLMRALEARDVGQVEKILYEHVGNLPEEADTQALTPSLTMTPTMAALQKRCQIEEADLPDLTTLEPKKARALFEKSRENRNKIDKSELSILSFDIPANPLSKNNAKSISAVQVSYKKTKKSLGKILYLHGGGWVFGSTKTHLNIMAKLAQSSGCEVIGIDYALAPEAAFPTGLNECTWAWRWLRAQASAEDEKLAWYVAGDSSGANLALAMMLDLRNVAELLPDAAALFYGAYSPMSNTESHQLCGQGEFGLTTQRMTWYWQQYLGGEQGVQQQLLNPRANLLRAELANLCPLWLCAAGLDPLRDDSVQLIQRLAQTNTPFEFKLYEAVVHGFLHLNPELPEAIAAIEDASTFLRARSSCS